MINGSLKIEVEKEGKEELVDREVRVKLNEVKDNLEKAIYTEDDSDIEDEQLKAIYEELANLKNQNDKLDEMGVKVPVRNKKKTAEKLKYFEEIDGKQEINTLEKQSEILYNYEISKLDAKIHGSAVDIIDLINNIG